MSRIVPAEYILTDEAIDELVGADPHFRRLKAEWLAASGEAKNKAYIEVNERQNHITDQLVEAVKAHRLQPVALQRTAAGEWVEYGIPKRYRETLGGELSLWRGSAEKVELEPGDEWIRRAPLCFRRGEFHEWLATAVVVRPMGGEDLPTWWTVPEAAVWIATRDLAKVQSLDLRARGSLFVASEVVSGTYEASFELLAGLRAGRLLALGWRRTKGPIGPSQSIPPDFWKAPTEFSETETGVEGLRAPDDRRVGLLLASDEVMAKWESPRSLLDGEKIPLGVAVGRLMHESLTAYLLRHADVCVTGLNANGERVEVDKDVFRTNATIDRAAHSVRTADGRLHWSAVMVELRKAASPVEPSLQKSDVHREDGVDALQLELHEWATKVCLTVRTAGRRIGKGPFTSLAWRRFGTGSGLTVDAIGAAWTDARALVGWPNAGTIPFALRIQDEELEKLASEAGLLDDGPLRDN